MEDDLWDRIENNALEITSLIITGAWLALLLGQVGGMLWLVVLIVGYAAVLPIVAILFDDEEAEHETADTSSESTNSSVSDDRSTADALETLRSRYASGDLTDDQFERKLERLLETETVEDADRWRKETAEEYETEFES